MKNIIVMGVGNYLLSDEGIGIHAIKELEKLDWPENVEIYDAGTTGVLSFHKFVEADVLIAIDSIELRQEAGTIMVYDKEDIMLSKIPLKVSSHQMGFQETLLQAELHGKIAEVVKLIGVVPDSYATDIRLSSVCQKALPKVIDIVKELVAEYNK